MLIVASWLVIRSGASSFQVALMIAGYVLLELALVVTAIPILIAEVALLASLAWPKVEVPAIQEPVGATR
jgi:hypothetical protein